MMQNLAWAQKKTWWMDACIDERVCVYVNRMDKHLSRINPPEFIAFRNFARAREWNGRRSVFYVGFFFHRLFA